MRLFIIILAVTLLKHFHIEFSAIAFGAVAFIAAIQDINSL